MPGLTSPTTAPCATEMMGEAIRRWDATSTRVPPDMRLPSTQELSDGELFYIIEDGIRLTGMPAWGSSRLRGESWQLVHFIRSLPRLTSQDLIEMEQLNPRSAAEWHEFERDEQFLRGEGEQTPQVQHGEKHHVH